MRIFISGARLDAGSKKNSLEDIIASLNDEDLMMDFPGTLDFAVTKQ